MIFSYHGVPSLSFYAVVMVLVTSRLIGGFSTAPFTAAQRKGVYYRYRISSTPFISIYDIDKAYH